MYSIQFLCPRNQNQDPLEKFFGSIRSYSVRIINPNVGSFANSFKSLLVRNMLPNHSPSSNCEKDNLEGLENLINMLISTNDHIKSRVVFPVVSI